MSSNGISLKTHLIRIAKMKTPAMTEARRANMAKARQVRAEKHAAKKAAVSVETPAENKFENIVDTPAQPVVLGNTQTGN